MSAVSPFDRNNIELFQPNQVAGLALWLDAADSSTVITSGANVTQWRDKSSNAHICISNANYTGTFLPTYNSNATYKNVNFTQDRALVTSNNWNYSPSWSCFVALNTVSLGGRWLISPFDGVSLVMMGMDRGISKIFSSAFNSVPADITGTHIEYTSAENTNAVSNLLWYRDGVIQASNVKSLGVPAGTAKMGIGANATFISAMSGNYQLYEVLIFNSYLSSTQRQQIESYLAYKWNLQRLLPTSHPYYASPYNAYPPFTNINQITKFAYPVLPNEVAGLSLWLDAADGSSVIRTGVNVTAWNDKSGNGFNMSNNASYQSPTYSPTGFNGKPTITFFRNSSNSFSILENRAFSFTTNSFTLFFISQRNKSETSFQRFFSGASNINWGDNNNAASFNINSYYNTGVTLERTIGGALVGVFTTTNPFLGEVIVNGTASNVGNFNTLTNYVYTNGTIRNSIGGLGAGSNLNIVHVRLGAATFTSATNDNGFEALQGNTSEVLLFNRVLTTSEFTQMEGYLAYKWGLQASLPITHPYYRNLFLPNVALSAPIEIANYQYSPRSISGLALWLDAADTSRMTLVGSNISEYIDKSTNGIILSNATSANQPTLVLDSNNMPNMLFNGTSQTLSRTSIAASNLSLNNEVTIFFVHTPTNSVNSIINWGANPRINFHTPEGPTGFKFDYPESGLAPTGGRLEATVANYLTSGRRLEGGYKRGTTQVIRAYGLDLATRTNALTLTGSTSRDLTFGGFNPTGYYYAGRFCELVWYNRGLNDNEIQQIEGYLAWKWGLQKSLPSNHPFYLFPQG